MWKIFRKTQIQHLKPGKYHFESLATHLKLKRLPSQQRLFYTITLISIFFLLSNSFQLGRSIQSSVPSAFAYDSVFVTDDEGFLIKSMPATSRGDYSNRTDIVSYEVQSGDTVSGIAYTFGLKVRTILENNPSLGAGNYLKVGQSIKILPVDGLLYEIAKGDTIASLATKYKIEEDKIIEQNSISGDLVAGTNLILPGATLPRPVYIASSTSSYSGGYVDIGVQVLNVNPSSSGIINPAPDNSRYSRGTRGHGYRALDLSRADKSWVPNIIAACTGNVITAKSSGYNGGYGLYIEIACDNGYTVLTAHHSQVYVQVGERVVQGQIISKMGTTGASSGIHVHIEVKDSSGNRLEPTNFFSINY